MQGDQGFTLVELLVTLAVATILLAVGVPSFASFVANSQLTSQANDLLGAAALGRSEAIRRNQAVTLCRTQPDGTSCARGQEWRAWILLVDGEVLRRGDVDGRGNTLHVRSDLPQDTVVFLPDGMASLGGGALVSNESIRVCSTRLASDNLRALMLSPSGQVTSRQATAAC